MDRRHTFSSVTTDGTDYVIHTPVITMKNRLRNFFGLPKPINDEHIDHEQSMVYVKYIKQVFFFIILIILANKTILSATIFLEDAVNYRSIVHKVTKFYLLIYRWFTSPLIQK